MDYKKEIEKLQKIVLDLNEEIKILKKDSHPPIINKEEIQEIKDGHQETKEFFENIVQITTIINEEQIDDGMAN